MLLKSAQASQQETPDEKSDDTRIRLPQTNLEHGLDKQQVSKCDHSAKENWGAKQL
jgi:hypothetical protein